MKAKELTDVVYLPTPVDRKIKAEWHAKGFKVLPLEMKPADDESEKPRRGRKPKEQEAE